MIFRAQSIRAQKDFEWKKESCKERPLGIGRKHKSPPEGTKHTAKQQRHFDAFQELAKQQQLARLFIEASVSYLLQQRKEEAAQKQKAAEETEAKAKEHEARKKEEREHLRKQQAQREREEQEELEALEPALQQLSSMAETAAIIAPSLFLRHLYSTHPPTGGAPQIVPGADCKNLLNTIRAYHTDKQSPCASGLRTHILCSEITKILNGLLESHR